MTDQPSDDELRAALRRADPAADLPPADPTRVARLLEEAMSHHPSTETERDTLETPSEPIIRTGRGPLTWVLAAAAAVVIAGVGGIAVFGGDDDSSPVAGSSTVQPGDETVTTIRAGSGVDGRCMTPTADRLAAADIAFSGTVTSLEGGIVTLDPGDFYAGKATDVVEIEAPSSDLSGLVESVDFRAGQRYYVAATGGDLMLCGYSGADSPDIEQLYATAFNQ
ncbi:hypothetical protein [Nocardioides acrostichi]|uniref:Uncharacterized protein n=1 Tax=Nocardioides acrostichi TaxID=2784339 RepID=A0A930V0L8_9ACTN|nr:hypothetical protein [Nocardioides acrostichi]MBF4161535.1 hypothetical protein [Nocardioides acrostichi]